jgi:hypothetical protein
MGLMNCKPQFWHCQTVNPSCRSQMRENCEPWQISQAFKFCVELVVMDEGTGPRPVEIIHNLLVQKHRQAFYTGGLNPPDPLYKRGSFVFPFKT